MKKWGIIISSVLVVLILVGGGIYTFLNYAIIPKSDYENYQQSTQSDKSVIDKFSSANAKLARANSDLTQKLENLQTSFDKQKQSLTNKDNQIKTLQNEIASSQSNSSVTVNSTPPTATSTPSNVNSSPKIIMSCTEDLASVPNYPDTVSLILSIQNLTSNPITVWPYNIGVYAQDGSSFDVNDNATGSMGKIGNTYDVYGQTINPEQLFTGIIAYNDSFSNSSSKPDTKIAKVTWDSPIGTLSCTPPF